MMEKSLPLFKQSYDDPVEGTFSISMAACTRFECWLTHSKTKRPLDMMDYSQC